MPPESCGERSTTMNPNPLPELDEEYPVDLSESICINCDDLKFLHSGGHWKPCPRCNPNGTPELPKEATDDNP